MVSVELIANFVVPLAVLGLIVLLLLENLRLYRQNRSFARRERELERHLETDPLTGLHNRLLFARLHNSQDPVHGVVAVMDMDGLKQVNDELGHLAGDEIIREAGNVIRHSIRKQDLACRWGGDEFIILFQNENLDAVRERLRQLEAHLWRFQLRGFGRLPLRISWGLAEARGNPLSAVIEQADERMYEMKRRRKSASQPSNGAHAAPVRWSVRAAGC